MMDTPTHYRRADFGRTRYTPATQLRDPQFLERWAAIYHLALTIPDDRRFDMGTFGERTETACSTSACLAGHAMVNGWFEQRGLKLGKESTFLSLHFDQSEWFGLPTEGQMWEYSPFDPYWARRLIKGEVRLTPILMSEVVMAWMMHHWSQTEIDAALEATKDVRYSVEDVHRLTPWKGALPDQPIPVEQEVKTPE